MLSKVKTALRISTSTFDQELTDLIIAACSDLEVTGAILPVTIGTADVETEDALVAQAIITYCRVNWGQPDDYDKMKASYDEQKAQIKSMTKYRTPINGQVS